MSSVDIRRHADPPPGWGALAATHGTFYHLPAWILGLRDCFDFRVHFLGLERHGALVAGLALAEVPALFGRRRLVSLPFSYAAGTLAASVADAHRLSAEARELARELDINRVEIKQGDDDGAPPPEFARARHYSTFRVITGDGEQAVWKRLHAGSTQRSIRKGTKAGVTVATSEEEAGWLTMARLQEQTSHRLGLPAPPRRFFTVTCRHLQSLDLAQLYLARMPDGTTGAGIVVWKGPRDWIYAFGASLPSALELRPNHVLLWAAIRDAISAHRGFDLGRAAPEQTGLTEFKRRWGAVEVPLAYDYWPEAGGLNVARRDAGPLALAARIWRHLPAPVARAGSMLYRYLG